VLPPVLLPRPLHPSIVLKDMEVAAKAGRAARHTLPRPQAHLRDPAAYKGDPPEDCERDAQALEYRDNAGHLQPRHTGFGRGGSQRDGGRAEVSVDAEAS
jgi:hypothetical protein